MPSSSATPKLPATCSMPSTECFGACIRRPGMPNQNGKALESRENQNRFSSLPTIIGNRSAIPTLPPPRRPVDGGERKPQTTNHKKGAITWSRPTHRPSGSSSDWKMLRHIRRSRRTAMGVFGKRRAAAAAPFPCCQHPQNVLGAIALDHEKYGAEHLPGTQC